MTHKLVDTKNDCTVQCIKLCCTSTTSKTTDSISILEQDMFSVRVLVLICVQLIWDPCQNEAKLGERVNQSADWLLEHCQRSIVEVVHIYGRLCRTLQCLPTSLSDLTTHTVIICIHIYCSHKPLHFCGETKNRPVLW